MKKLALALGMVIGMSVMAAVDLTESTDAELMGMLKQNTEEIAALTELADRGKVSIEAIIEYANPYKITKWTTVIADRMIIEFNSVNWYEWSGGDPKKIVEVCKKLLIILPVTDETGKFLSVIQDKKTLLE